MVKKIHDRARMYKEKTLKRDDDGPASRERVGKVIRLKYAKLDSNWGLSLNEMKGLENQELARNRFLESCPGLERAGNKLPSGFGQLWIYLIEL